MIKRKPSSCVINPSGHYDHIPSTRQRNIYKVEKVRQVQVRSMSITIEVQSGWAYYNVYYTCMRSTELGMVEDKSYMYVFAKDEMDAYQMVRNYKTLQDTDAEHREFLVQTEDAMIEADADEQAHAKALEDFDGHPFVFSFEKAR